MWRSGSSIEECTADEDPSMRNESPPGDTTTPCCEDLQGIVIGQETLADIKLLSPEHRILERRFMAFPPFGKDSHGEPVRDMGGVSIRSNVEYLEESTILQKGSEAGRDILAELVAQLNLRIPDPA